MHNQQYKATRRSIDTLHRRLPVLWLASLFILTGFLCSRPVSLFKQPPASPAPTAALPSRPTSTPTSRPTATATETGQSATEVTPTEVKPTKDPAPITGDSTSDAIAAAVLSPRDRYDLAARLLNVDQIPEVSVPENGYQVGDTLQFWVDNDLLDGVLEVTAELVYAGPHVYMWVEQGASYDAASLVFAAEHFEQSIYPTTRAYFGSEPLPGIDGDPRLHILHSISMSPGVAGYFYSPSEYPSSIVQYSNEKEMFFINISNTPPESIYYNRVLAHEFQHMIHWNIDSNESSWLNEGMSELSAFLNGNGQSTFTSYFVSDPDIQLTDWPEENTPPHYGGAFLFVTYFLDRFGQEAMQTLASHPENGLDSVNATLQDLNSSVDADQVFVDWTVANWLNDLSIEPGIYGYSSLTGSLVSTTTEILEQYPARLESASVHQYGTDYIQLVGPARVRLEFDGSDQVQVLPTDTWNTDGDPDTDDRFAWWSNRGDDSDMTLTRHFDLTDVDEVLLEYDLWYWIEERWDYGYVEVSADEGQTWTILSTGHTTAANPHGTAYGPGYTGQSSSQPGANAQGWIHEQVDLSQYAGQQILVRFEMITDDAVNLPGMAVDNISIEAINYRDDLESGAGGWEAGGFARLDNIMAQRFSLQVILPGEDGKIEVLPVLLNAANEGSITITIAEDSAALVIVSGLTRYTTQPALYNLFVTPAGQ